MAALSLVVAPRRTGAVVCVSDVRRLADAGN